jgi:hypothetical protein
MTMFIPLSALSCLSVACYALVWSESFEVEEEAASGERDFEEEGAIYRLEKKTW